HPNGAAHFGAWIAIIEIAAKQDERGTLPCGIGGISKTLSRISRIPSTIFDEALPRLIEIGWISGESAGDLPSSPNDPPSPPTISQQSAIVRHDLPMISQNLPLSPETSGAQRRELQGMELQGMELQGMELQGMELQGNTEKNLSASDDAVEDI